MEFGTPTWLWLLAASPLVVLGAALGWRRRLGAATAWAARGLWDRLLPTEQPRRRWAWNLLLALVVVGAALALARPRWGVTEREVERAGVDVVFVLDSSLSMATADVEPSRLWVGQTLVRRLVQELPGYRVALVQAEGDGVVMVPLTGDNAIIDMMLDAVVPASLPTPGTALRPALERARALFPVGGRDGRAVVLVSDGEDHGSGLGGIAAELRRTGIVVHAVGVGTLDGQPLELPRLSADAPVEYKRDEAGHVVVSRLIESNLEQLSRDTGGVYLRAEGVAVDLTPLLAAIGTMEAGGERREVVHILGERFQWPIGMAILALGLLLLISPFRARVSQPMPAPVDGRR